MHFRHTPVAHLKVEGNGFRPTPGDMRKSAAAVCTRLNFREKEKDPSADRRDLLCRISDVFKKVLLLVQVLPSRLSRKHLQKGC